MFCSDTLAVQQLGLRTSWCHFHHSLRFLPPRATHTTALWQLSTFLTTLYELKLQVLTCPQAFSSPPRILHIFDNCILRPATQLNWSWLSLSLWLSCSQRQWTPKTGLVDQPFTGYMCTWYLAAQKGRVSNKYLFSQGARPEHSRGFMSCLLNFSEYNSCCDLLENSSPTEIPSHQRSPTFRNTAHRTEHTTLDAALLGKHEEVGRYWKNRTKAKVLFPSHTESRLFTCQKVTQFLILQKPLLLFKAKDFHSPHSTLYSLHKECILTALLQGTAPGVLFCVLGSSGRQVWPFSQRTLSLAHPVMFGNTEFDEEPHLSCPSPKLKAPSKTGMLRILC